MTGRSPPNIHNHPPSLQQGLLHSFNILHSYDQERIVELGSINSILSKPRPFLKERKCQKQSEWFQQYFNFQEQSTEMNELIQYYRYYRNSPMIVDLKFMEVMLGYWSRRKALYYKQVKKELQLQDQGDSSLTPQPNAQSEHKSKPSETLFQLPSQLQSVRNTFLNDPDATLRHLLTAMNTKSFKEETREASQVGEFQQKSAKSHKKGQHIRTNPSHLGSCSSMKKQRRKNTHKSHSNQTHRSPSRQKKVNTFVGVKKVNTKASETTLNYQRRNKQPKTKKNRWSHNKFEHKLEYKVQHKLEHKIEHKIPNRESSTGKNRSCQKESSKRKVKKVSSGKLRQVESTKVKAAITKVRDKIKAEKNVMMKKYFLERQSCTRSIQTKHVQMRRSRK